ncbi:hypothetical protein [cf. Phormidesmis sp. LEGE 11477]|uniref:hypothetical protein n=1 Tax=cf. Phormidesmis sp. LEGE 11477 TaxID=1828680 RepID=UPI0018801DAB|nr:hypothetical protein [cf. Phormidesmis sp. LEGE 11477]MBE9061829.1 hypothetical protein [cf. Phormidesmis sp. LEGE 11477]
MGKTSICGKWLSLTLKGVGAIAFSTAGAFFAIGILPGQAAEPQQRSVPEPTELTPSDRFGLKQAVPEENTAEDLKLSPESLLPDGDLSELPILEPSVPLDQPVSVPPIEPLEAPVSPTAEPTEAVVTQSQSEPEIPLEPPFIGDLAQPSTSETAAEPVPATEPAPTATEPASAPSPAATESVPAPATEPVPSAETLADGSPPFISPAATESAVTEPAATEPVATEPMPATVQTVRPANASRWPEPIPFGQPLPDS